MSLKRLHQIVIAEELLEATLRSGLFAPSFGSYQVIDPKIDFELDRFERNINRGSLTTLQGLSGTRKGKMTFGLELTGTSEFASPPQYGLPLRGCGFRQEVLIQMTIGAITGGPFRHGETVTQTGSSATAVVVQDTLTGQTKLYLANANGLGNGTAFTPTGLLTGGSSGATATPTGFAIRLTAGAITGTFQVGEAVTQATSSAGGVITEINLTTSIIYVRQTTTANFNTANVVTGGTSSATTTPSAVSTQAQAGYGWWPQSYALSMLRTNASGLTNAIADGDLLRTTDGALYQAFGAHADAAAAQFVYVRRIDGHTTATASAVTNVTQGNEAFISTGAGAVEAQFQIPSLSMGIAKDGVRESLKFARGTVSMAGQIGEAMIMNFEFRGAFDAIADQGNIASPTFAQTTPPVLIDADLAVGGSATTFAAEFIPCIRSMQLAMANEIAYRECMANAAGIDNTLIVTRKPTGSFDPDLQAEAVFPFMTDFLSNTSFRARFTVGSATGNKVLMSMPALSITSAPTGDRNGISTRELAFELTGGSQTVSSLNTENELVLIAPYVPS
jgi:hypothetical protein